MAYTYDYPRAAITADAVITRKGDHHEDLILLIKRKNPPFQGKWALPGGFMDINETLEECVKREVEEETGLTGINFRQAGAYSAIDRDPRHRTVTIVFYGEASSAQKPRSGSDSAEVMWFKLQHLPELAFDHMKIITNTIKALSKI